MMTSIPTGLDQADVPSSQNSHYYTAVVLFLWFSLIVVLGQNGFFIPEAGQPPVMLLASQVAQENDAVHATSQLYRVHNG